MIKNNIDIVNLILGTLVVLLIGILIFNFLNKPAHADYVIHDRMVEVTGWYGNVCSQVKVEYDQQGHVDCYVASGCGGALAISCIQK